MAAGIRSLLAWWLGGASAPASATLAQGSSQVCIRGAAVYPAVALFDTSREGTEGWADAYTLDEWSGDFTLDAWADAFGLASQTVRGKRLSVYAAVDGDATAYPSVAGDPCVYGAVEADPGVVPAIAGTVTVGCTC